MRFQSKISAVAFTLCIMVSIMFSFACKKSLGDRWVFHAAGTDVYSAPDVKSTLIAHLPQAEKVEAIKEEIDWVQIKWGDKTGWVQKSRLTNDINQLESPSQETAQSQFPPEQAIPLPELEAAAKAFYENQLRQEFAGMPDLDNFINRVHKFGYTVKYKLGEFAVVKHGESFGGPKNDITNYEPSDALWQKKDGRWTEIIPNSGWGDKMHLYYMNNDEFPDLLVYHCVSDGCTLDVYFGKSDGTMQSLELPSGLHYYPETPGTIMKIGKCGETSIMIPDGDKKITISFDCAKNTLVKTIK